MFRKIAHSTLDLDGAMTGSRQLKANVSQNLKPAMAAVSTSKCEHPTSPARLYAANVLAEKLRRNDRQNAPEGRTQLLPDCFDAQCSLELSTVRVRAHWHSGAPAPRDPPRPHGPGSAGPRPRRRAASSKRVCASILVDTISCEHPRSKPQHFCVSALSGILRHRAAVAILQRKPPQRRARALRPVPPRGLGKRILSALPEELHCLGEARGRRLARGGC